MWAVVEELQDCCYEKQNKARLVLLKDVQIH